MSRSFWLYITLLVAVLLQECASTHLKTKTQTTHYEQRGLCWAEFHQKGTWRISNADPQWLYARHGQCRDLNYVGGSLNDDTDFVSFDGDCDTCYFKLFDDANLRGDWKQFNRGDCKYRGETCELGDSGWDDRISSAQLCCGKKERTSDYIKPNSDKCLMTFTQDAILEAKDFDVKIWGSGCDERNYVGDDFNDNIKRIKIYDQCFDCTIQLFDDADYKGDSKTIKVGSNECPIATDGSYTKCGLDGWNDRVSSMKVCCPASIVV